MIQKDKEPYEEDFTVERDECNRPDTTLEGLAKLQPVFKKAEEGGTVTAGNASQLSDGASATLLDERRRARSSSASSRSASTAAPRWPAADRRRWASARCSRCRSCSKRHGLKLDDIDIIELNEAFASQLLYCQRELGIDNDKLNPLGGSISIGHPFGMTGSRMTGQLLRELKRQGKRYGIVTMCVGGGQGLASLFEVA